MTATTGELHAYLAADTTPASRKHVYGPGCWCRPIRDDVGALVHGDVDMEAEGARHLDTVRSLVASAKATAEAVRERDEAREALARVRALLDASDDGSQWEHNDGCEGEPTCPGCWSLSIRAALGGGAS